MEAPPAMLEYTHLPPPPSRWTRGTWFVFGLLAAGIWWFGITTAFTAAVAFAAFYFHLNLPISVLKACIPVLLVGAFAAGWVFFTRRSRGRRLEIGSLTRRRAFGQGVLAGSAVSGFFIAVGCAIACGGK